VEVVAAAAVVVVAGSAVVLIERRVAAPPPPRGKGRNDNDFVVKLRATIGANKAAKK